MAESPQLRLGAVQLAGHDDNADVLFVGAGLGTSATALWGSAAQALGARCLVIGLDLPGHGRSAPATRGFVVADVASAVRRLAEQAAARRARRIWYAGVSFAGAVALELARDPGPVRGVAALAAASTFGSPDAWRDRAARVRQTGTRELVSASAQRWFAPGFATSHPQPANRLLNDLEQADDESYARCCLALAQFDVRDTLPHLQLPVLLAPGQLDAVIPPARAADDVANLPLGELYVFDGVAHQPPVEAPRAVAMRLAEFIDNGREST